jgi:transcription elongation GreA/GreB family factor
MTVSKSAVIRALHQALQDEIVTLESVAAMARDEATSSETKSEGKYDTRATEASYLARGQAVRISELRRLHAWYDRLEPDDSPPERIRLGTLVEIEREQPEWIFLAPFGGSRANIQGQKIRVISPSSPLGKALLNLQPGDALEVQTPRGLREYEVLRVL